MSEHVHFPEARRRLWLGYSFLLKLAAEPDEDNLEETELDEVNETVETPRISKLSQQNNNSSKAEPESTVKAE